jgi:hypothetical protein
MTFGTRVRNIKDLEIVEEIHDAKGNGQGEPPPDAVRRAIPGSLQLL